MAQEYFCHESAHLEKNVSIGKDSKIWHECQLREDCVIGDDVSLGKGVFVDKGVKVGNGCRVQNGVSIYHGVKLAEWVFVGPNVTFTNDTSPRAGAKIWEATNTILKPGCSIGAGAIILSDLEIGSFAMVGAASIVTTDVEPFTLVFGVPAKVVSRICACGKTRLDNTRAPDEFVRDCCVKHLKSEVILLAKEEIKKL